MIGDESDHGAPDSDSLADLLQQPLEREIDDFGPLGIDVDDEEGPNTYLDVISTGGEGNGSDGSSHSERHSGAGSYTSEDYRNGYVVDDDDYKCNNTHGSIFFYGPPSPDPRPMMNRTYDSNSHTERCARPKCDEHKNRSDIDTRESYRNMRHERTNRRPRRNQERIAEVQQRIAQVQQQIRSVQHETMNDDQLNEQQYQVMDDHRNRCEHHQGFSENYHDEDSVNNGNSRDMRRDTGYLPRTSSRHKSTEDDEFGNNGRPGLHPKVPHRRGDSIMPRSMNDTYPHTDIHCSGNNFGPQDRMQDMNPMPRYRSTQGMTQSLNDMPPCGSNGSGSFRVDNVRRQQHVVGGLSQSLNGMSNHRNNGSNNSPMMQQLHNIGSTMHRSLNGSLNGRMSNMNMNSSNNSGMPPSRGIQSMSDSLNGLPDGGSNQSNRMNRITNENMTQPSSVDRCSNRNLLDRSNNGNVSQHRGIQSMSSSINAQQSSPGQMMSQSMNGMQGSGGSGEFVGHQGRPGPTSPPTIGIQMSRSLNGIQSMQQGLDESGIRTVNHTSSTINDIPHVNNDDFGHRGQNALQGLSQSLNGAPNSSFRIMDHHQSMNNMGCNLAMGTCNDGRNMMHGQSNLPNNNGMTASNNGAPVLNNSIVPSTSLLNQVSNLANLPNNGGNPINSGIMNQSSPMSMKIIDNLEGSNQHGGTNHSKMGNPMALAEATMRSASSRKMIRELGLSLGKLQRSAENGGLSKLSSHSKETVVKAKRKWGRESYSRLQTEVAFREHTRQMKVQQHGTESS